VLPFCPCVVSFSKLHEHDTHDSFRTRGWHHRSILVRHVRHAARFPRDMLATSSRGCHEDATRMQRGNCFRGISSLQPTHRTQMCVTCNIGRPAVETIYSHDNRLHCVCDHAVFAGGAPLGMRLSSSFLHVNVYTTLTLVIIYAHISNYN